MGEKTKSAHLRFRFDVPKGTESSLVPPSDPPPDNWIITYDRLGNPKSRYGDDKWDYSEHGYNHFNYFKFDIVGVCFGNQNLMKRLVFNMIYHSEITYGELSTVNHYAGVIKQIAQVCSSNNILISDLYKYPSLFKNIAETIKPYQRDRAVYIIDKLNEEHIGADLGFSVGGGELAAYIRNNVKDRLKSQTAYIPDRINAYLMERLESFIHDFNDNVEHINGVYQWIVRAYKVNSEYAEQRGIKLIGRVANPFCAAGKGKPCYYEDGFDHFAKEQGIHELLSKWVDDTLEEKLTILRLSKYLKLANYVGLIYIMHYSLQRQDEAANLPLDCLKNEYDEKLGVIHYLVGETTKTIQDHDARWIVPSKAKLGVELINQLAQWESNWSTPNRLLISSKAPWLCNTASLQKPKLNPFSSILEINTKLLDEKYLIISKEDYAQAIALTPTLVLNDWFQIGQPWRFNYHQSRRTGVVRMFRWGVSKDSTQFMAKHKTVHQTIYYGRNHTKLKLNESLSQEIVSESYNAIYRSLSDVVANAKNSISPHKREPFEQEIIRLINEKESKALMTRIKKGQVGYRETLLGGCTRQGSCEYGGIESVAKCAGGVDGNSACKDLRVSPRRYNTLMTLKEKHLEAMKSLDQDSPQYNAKKAEVYGIEVYERIIEKS
ncbi:hypothetical protein A3740_01040 [Oleiphilus sp. HI0068]|nr:hypothetical protein A3740_01040 [Oleiphilus sp. HI0068]KZY79774.1 hypothetical protein A3741_06410 [Oleiphilus sp. HI0069]KZZ39824.1 hypothetical protein A3755_04480 [Oleiphilus sp. HI0085]